MSSVFVSRRTLASGAVRWRLQCRYKVGNDTKQAIRVFTNEPIARKWEAVLKAAGVVEGLAMLDAQEDPDAAPTGPTVADLIDRHLERLTGVTPGTRLDYRRIADRDILPALGAIPALELSREHIAAWVNAMDAAGVAAKTIANKHGLLSSICTAAVEAGDLGKNPCRGMRLPTGERRAPVFLTLAQVGELVGAVPDYWRPLVVVLAGTGMRFGEVTALRGQDVTVTATTVTVSVERAWKRTAAGPRQTGAPKTRRSRRTFTLRRPSPAADTLAARAAQRPGDRLLFTSPRGAAVRSGYFHDRAWTPAKKTLEGRGWGSWPTVHDLRHTAASLMIAAGEEVHAVSAILGHEKVSTTLEVYGHFRIGAREAALATLGDELGKVLPGALS